MRIISCRIHFMFSSAPHFLLKLTKKVRLCHVKAFFANVTYSLRWRQKDRVVVLRLVFNKYSICSVDLLLVIWVWFCVSFITDPPEIEIEQNWYEREGVVEVEIICVVHANPIAEVYIQIILYYCFSKYVYICIFTLHIIFIFIVRCIGLKDRKSCMKQTERYSRKRLDEIHCTSEMYNPVILEIIHAEQIMIWERQERIHLFRVSSIKH